MIGVGAPVALLRGMQRWLCASVLTTLGALVVSGCTEYTVVEPGHRGVYFDPSVGVMRESLNPGRYAVGGGRRVHDYLVVYSRRREEVQATSRDLRALGLTIAVQYRPIVSELYQLDAELGPNYYDEVVGPEFRSAARGVFARHGAREIARENERIENEIERELQRRTQGKHVEISAILIERVTPPPEALEVLSNAGCAETR